MVAFFHQHETHDQAVAREHAAEIAQLLKELGEYQGCILTTLGIMIRSGASKATLEQIKTFTDEYGIRFKKILDYASTYRLSAPTPNRYST